MGLFCWCLLALPAWAQPKSTPQPVFIGMYLNKVVGLDLKQNTSWMDFYVWFRWKGELDPTESYEFMNSFEKWGETNIAESEAPRVLANGWKYREFRIEIQFHSPFDFNAYPLDEQVLRITLEDKSYTSKRIRFIPDAVHSAYNPEISIPGWRVMRQEITSNQHTYSTNFGQMNQPNETYSRINYDLRISRYPRMLQIFKLFLPVLIILVMVLVVFFIPISFFESRIEIAVTGLLSLIALQMVLNDTLPPVGYLTLTDKIYYFSYFVVMCSLIETVWVYFSFKRDEQVARQIDRVASFAMLLLTPVIFALFFTVLRG